MLQRLRYMLAKEYMQALRDPRMRMVLFAAPVIQLFVLAFAITTDVRDSPLAVLDRDNTPASRELVAAFEGSRHFRITRFPADEREMTELLDHGSVRGVLNIPAGFEQEILARREAPLQLIVDGTDSNTSSIVLGYAGNVISRFNEDQLARRAALAGTVHAAPAIEVDSRAWFNQNLSSRHFYLPGLMCTVLLVITLLLTALAVVREKEIGTIEQIMVTPLQPLELILGKTIPFASFGFLAFTLMLCVVHFAFDLPIRGSIALLYLGLVLFLFSTLSMGLLISTVSATQQQAMLTVFLYLLPMVLLSGFMFPIANMPALVRWVTYLDPMRYLIVIMRGVMLKGIGLEVLWPQYAALAVLGTVTTYLAAKRFKKTLA